MRLHTIKLSGFKSFVDPTTIHFPGSLHAIVGPNGSGKSNVFDAVRWVLGESSAKYLRSEILTDVIFNGSTSRKPVGQASVELIFDNMDGKLGGEYSRYQQISVKRIVNREGESIYYLNNMRCRRRDVTDLFLGTGLGPRSYAMILQDTISRLIEAKPDELRTYLEEVAGISKYKERRKETELKIKQTRDNLARLNDIRIELSKQLDHLNKQAKTAERYKKLKEEECLLKAKIYTLNWLALDKNLQQCKNHILQLENQLQAEIAKLQAFNAEAEYKQTQLTDISEIYETIQESYYQTGIEVSRLEQNKLHQNERKQQFKIELHHLDQQIEKLDKQIIQEQTVDQQLRNTALQLEPKLNEHQQKASQLKEFLQAAEINYQTYQKQWEEFQALTTKLQQQTQLDKKEIEHLQYRLDDLTKRIAKLQEEKKSIAIDPVESKLSFLEESLADKLKQKKEQEQILAEFSTDVLQLEQDKQNLLQKFQQEQNELHKTNTQLASIQALQQAALGTGEKNASEWLKQKGLLKLPRIAELIEVQSGWELAVETVLQHFLEAIFIDEISAFSHDLETNKSKLTLVEKISGEHLTLSIVQTSLAAKVKAPHAILALLNSVYTADTVSQALSLVKELQFFESVVTPQGIWVSKYWLHAHEKQQKGIIIRQKQITQLQAFLKTKEENLKQIKADLEAVEKQVKESVVKKTEYQTKLFELTTKITEHNAQVQINQAERNRLQMRDQQIQNELVTYQTQLANYHDQNQIVKTNLELHSQELAKQQSLHNELINQRENARKQWHDLQKQNEQNNSEVHRLTLEFENTKTKIESLIAHHQQTKIRLTELQAQKQNILDQLESFKVPLAELEKQLAAILDKRLTIEHKLNETKQQMNALEQAIQQVRKQYQTLEKNTQTLRQQINDLQIQNQTYQVQKNNIADQIKEINSNLMELVEQVNNENLNTLEAALNSVRQRLERLGPINLAAIDEYNTLMERKSYLDAQNSDLEEALAILENAIYKIDRETRQRFKETFNQVNGYFSALFPKIFGGGKASLELTSEELLDAGVSVQAQPPGKRNSTVNILSGGEKALTAIALVFSFFQLNPAPFCLLDEVDAPLDDANIIRYCNLVKELSNTVQFIFVSHNKLAIEMADHLIGVAMQEPGVSRLVMVDIEQAINLATA